MMTEKLAMSRRCLAGVAKESAAMLYDHAMIASLPMYDWPEVRSATDAWWRGIASHLGMDLPLSRLEDYASVWRRQDVLMSQTCGYPFTHALAGKVRLVATPHYNADGCNGPNYCSIILARQARPLKDFRGAVAAVNTPDSMSGMLALKLVFAPFAEDGRFFAKAVGTGGHLSSIKAVRTGTADVCAVDAVCLGLAKRHRPEDLDGLVEIARSPQVPGLPYITTGGDVVRLREALRRAFGDPDLQETRDQLLLSGHSVLAPQDYTMIREREAQMEQAGGLQLL
jgi:ABC-type phosphate/phosphonate transport system substrate-binding protein